MSVSAWSRPLIMSGPATSRPVIIAGVDGGDAGLRAVDYAVVEAQLYDAAPVIAHVVDQHALLGIAVPAGRRKALLAAGHRRPMLTTPSSRCQPSGAAAGTRSPVLVWSKLSSPWPATSS